MKNFNEIADFFFELSVLKKMPRSGSLVAGILRPDTVGEHVFRASELAYLLAEMEGGNGEHSAFIALIHDNGEARIGDHHRIMNRYFDIGDAEKRAFFDQCERLPEKIAKKFKQAYVEYEEQKTIEGKCARDADLLELALQSKEFLEQGFKGKKNWLDNIKPYIQTKTGKDFFKAIEEKSYNDWWQNLKKLPRKK